MRKLEPAALSALKKNTPLITSALMAMAAKCQSKCMETLQLSPLPTPDEGLEVETREGERESGMRETETAS